MPTLAPRLRLGSRGSPFAPIQANLVRDAPIATHGWDAQAIEIVVVRATGDKVQDRAPAIRRLFAA